MALNRRIAEIYDRDPARYDRMMTSFMDRVLGRGRPQLGALAQGRVLEIGIGTGLSLPYYRAGVSLTGIDLSPKMLAVAKKRAESAKFPVALGLMDAQRLAFPDGEFDSVVFSLCLCTIPDPTLAVREAVRVAKPGARLLLLEHVRSPHALVGAIQDLINPLTVHFQQDHFNRRTIELVKELGLQVELVDRWGLGIIVVAVGRVA